MRHLSLIAALSALTACQLDGVRPGSQIGSETGGCAVANEIPIDDASAAPDGFSLSADEVALALGDFAGPLERVNGEVLDLSLSLSQDGGATLLEMELPPGSSIEIACSDLIALPAVATLDADGVLQEDIPVTVYADPGGYITLFAQVEADALQGSAAPDSLDPAELAVTWFSVTADHDGAGWVGGLTFWGETHPQGRGDDATVSAVNDPWGDFEVGAAE